MHARVHIVYIPHARVNSECMFVSVDSVVLCNWLTASKTILLSASIVNKEYLVKISDEVLGDQYFR